MEREKKILSIGFRISSELKKEIEVFAIREKRDMSSAITFILAKGLLDIEVRRRMGIHEDRRKSHAKFNMN